MTGWKQGKKGEHKNLFDDIKERLKNLITSRLTILSLLFLTFGAILVYRCFKLQIVNGEEYLNDFILQTEKTRDISSTRGNIYDCNGNLLAYNELAYSVKIEDVFESNRKKNANMNATIYKLIKMIEKVSFCCNYSSVISDVK